MQSSHHSTYGRSGFLFSCGFQIAFATKSDGKKGSDRCLQSLAFTSTCHVDMFSSGDISILKTWTMQDLQIDLGFQSSWSDDAFTFLPSAVWGTGRGSSLSAIDGALRCTAVRVGSSVLITQQSPLAPDSSHLLWSVNSLSLLLDLLVEWNMDMLLLADLAERFA